MNAAQPDYVRESTIDREFPGDVVRPFVHGKTVRVYDSRHQVAVEEKHLCTQGGATPTYARLSRSQFYYNIDGQLVQELRDGRVISSIAYDANGYRTQEWDETGRQTVYSNFNEAGRAQTVTQVGCASAGADAPAQPDAVTTFTYDILGREVTRASTAGGQTLSHATTYDTAGRTLSETTNGVTQGFVRGVDNQTGWRYEGKLLPGGLDEYTYYYADGKTYDVAGTAALPVVYGYGMDNLGVGMDRVAWTKATTLGVADGPWRKTTRDWRGRTILEESAKTDWAGAILSRMMTYDARGRLLTENLSGAVLRTMTYAADGLEQTEVRKVDGGNDVSLTTSLTYELEGATWYRVSTVKTTADQVVRSASREQVTAAVDAGVLGWRTGYRQTTNEAGDVAETFTYLGSSGVVQRSSRSGAAGYAETVSRNGRVESTRAAGITAATVRTYDGLGRLAAVRDARTGLSTLFTYDATYPEQVATQVLTVPAGADPAAGQSSSVTQTYYGPTTASAGRVYSRDENGTITFTSYTQRGEVAKVWGDTYPTWTEYDGAGRLWKLHTYLADPGVGTAEWPQGSVTTWSYAPGTSLLVAKTDAAGKATTYTYNDRNQLLSRKWARLDANDTNLETFYNADFMGRVTSTSYSDGTPASILSAPDALGRYTVQTDAAGTKTLTYGTRGLVASESYGGGLLDGWALSRAEGAWGRQESTALSGAGVPQMSATYGYDATTGRMASVTDGTHSATYAYLANSNLLQSTTLSENGTPQLIATRTIDALNRLSRLDTQNLAGTVLQRTLYTYDSRGRRTEATEADATRWQYGYDTRNQVTSGVKKLADGTPALGQAMGYGFDAIGNRTSGTVNGRTSAWAANSLNELVQRTIPGAIDILGDAAPINNQPSTINPSIRISGGVPPLATPAARTPSRQGTLYYKEVPVDNSTAPQHALVEVKAFPPSVAGQPDHVATETGQIYVPKTPEVFTYDADGNMTSDGRWKYTWDGENRLIGMENVDATVPVSARFKETNAYDGQSRRIRHTIESWNPQLFGGDGGWQPVQDRIFLWDGWNQIAEADFATLTAKAKYTWGLDLSATLQGAGGVGGLVWEEIADSNGAWQKALPAYDGNGNLRKLYAPATMSVQADYTYGPFGEPLKATGTMAALNPWRWSTKYTGNETGVVYYQRRGYKADLGRWLSKDPIQERGGVNLYGMLGNSLVDRVDYLGYQLSLTSAQIELIEIWIAGGMIAEDIAALIPGLTVAAAEAMIQAARKTAELKATCEALDVIVKAAKEATARLGACNFGDTLKETAAKTAAWLAFSDARWNQNKLCACFLLTDKDRVNHIKEQQKAFDVYVKCKNRLEYLIQQTLK